MKRTVLDTNIIISSALGGALVLILERWDKGEFTVIVTSEVLREYFEVLNPNLALNLPCDTWYRKTLVRSLLPSNL